LVFGGRESDFAFRRANTAVRGTLSPRIRWKSGFEHPGSESWRIRIMNASLMID